MTNLVADPTFQTNATISGDGTFVDNGDGTFQIDFDGSGGSKVVVNLSVPLIPGHRYERVAEVVAGNAHGLKSQLIQNSQLEMPSIGAANLWGTGTYDYTSALAEPNGQVAFFVSPFSGSPFSLKGNVSVIDLDA